jgi:hypothetical protein
LIRQSDRQIAPEQRVERDEAAIAPRKIGTLPHITEQAILRVFAESQRNHLNFRERLSPPQRWRGSRALRPNQEEKAFDAIRDAMKHKGRVAWPALSLQTTSTSLREPWDKGMLGTRSGFDYEVRDEKEFFKAIATHRKPKEMVSLAAHILDTKPTTPTLRKLVKRKAAGKPTWSSS